MIACSLSTISTVPTLSLLCLKDTALCFPPGEMMPTLSPALWFWPAHCTPKQAVVKQLQPESDPHYSGQNVGYKQINGVINHNTGKKHHKTNNIQHINRESWKTIMMVQVQSFLKFDVKNADMIKVWGHVCEIQTPPHHILNEIWTNVFF